jgi:hypothetical protein
MVVGHIEDPLLRKEMEVAIETCTGDLQNQALQVRYESTIDRRVLNSLDIPNYHHVITLSYSDILPEQQADAVSLVTLLHLRDIAESSGRSFSIVSEMLDTRNRDLAEVTRADDFIVSDKLVSLIMTQISENRELSDVFMDLFDPQGSELYLKPVEDYVATGQAVNFYTVIEAARQRGQVAIGYRLRSLGNDAARAYGVKVNPLKSEQITFALGDRIIVLAED